MTNSYFISVFGKRYVKFIEVMINYEKICIKLVRANVIYSEVDVNSKGTIFWDHKPDTKAFRK